MVRLHSWKVVVWSLACIKPALLTGEIPWEGKRLQALYESLEPRSIAEQAAFAELFPDNPLGIQASQRVWRLLAGAEAGDPPPIWPDLQVQRLVNRFVFPSAEAPPILTEDQQKVLNRLAHPLANRALQGSKAQTEQEVLALPSEEVDLARGLLLAQGLPLDQIEAYERCLDLMALQVKARLPEDPTELDILRALSAFIFVEQRFRFPPRSRMSIHIDQWTMLSEVLDSRRGVCLGVSQLYLCLAQRLNLPLEIITPPGHIYVRWASEGVHWNIETTAHGIHLPSHHYLGLTAKTFHSRPLREVIGMSLYNAAAVPLHQGEYNKAISLYRHAKLYLGEDYDLDQALGMALFCAGRQEESRSLLGPLRGQTKPERVVSSHLIDEILDGDVTPDLLGSSLKIHRPVRSDLLAQQIGLQKAIERCPRFFYGYQELAQVHLQLGRLQQAYEVLQSAHAQGAREVYVLYLLTELAFARYDLPHSALYFSQLEKSLHTADHDPPVLRELRLRLKGAGAPLEESD